MPRSVTALAITVLVVASVGAAASDVAARGGDRLAGSPIGRSVADGDGVERAAAGRIRGNDRFATAAAIAREAFPSGADVVYLARGGEPLVDALAGGALTDGPVLLVPPGGGGVPAAVRSVVSDLDPDRVVALGGPGAVSTAMLRGVAAGRDTDRVSGPDRYATAAAIARTAFPSGADVVYLARGRAPLVDALAGGGLSDGPVLLVPPGDGAAPTVVRSAVASLGPSHVVALGGTGAVSDAMLRALADGRATARIAGPDRYSTAAAIAREAFPTGAHVVYLARGRAPLVDALAGGALTDGPVLLVPPGNGPAPAVVRTTAEGLGASRVVALGGAGAISDAMLASADDALAPPLAPPTDCTYHELPDDLLSVSVGLPEGVDRFVVLHAGEHGPFTRSPVEIRKRTTFDVVVRARSTEGGAQSTSRSCQPRVDPGGGDRMVEPGNRCEGRKGSGPLPREVEPQVLLDLLPDVEPPAPPRGGLLPGPPTLPPLGPVAPPMELPLGHRPVLLPGAVTPPDGAFVELLPDAGGDGILAFEVCPGQGSPTFHEDLIADILDVSESFVVGVGGAPPRMELAPHLFDQLEADARRELEERFSIRLERLGPGLPGAPAYVGNDDLVVEGEMS